ncbi:prolyl-tRNA synthetase associated domain-containing protein [Pleionea sp. CnH1-48]|uniref:prolyl-tRNA synthetase associated domain-containing protein n=1 Tax=Pleionea sp. CnH1-48 TaxID=2954494 RepID=UPI0020984438|nr:prolyl-tRNA synthetase associated domain-containing protein [Pleionea sp. CnH1-48]MCO7223135.1 prolyl-tRNA synthetase associated domain-containing protein [Pleionea sp. CnH1-48]
MSFLRHHELPFEYYEHPPLATCQDADKLNLERSGARLKNLFLRDNYGRRHFLLITSPEKKVDLKALSRQLSISRIGFASAERLHKYLGIQPGCVSLLALFNDQESAVEFWIDRDIWQADAYQCHPLVNTATVVLGKEDVLKFLQLTGHDYQLVDVPQVCEPAV